MFDTQHEVKEWGMVIWTFFQSLVETVGAYLPNVIGAFLITLTGWIAARTLSKLTGKLLRACGITALGEKVKFNETLKKVGVSLALDQIFSSLVYYIVLLVFFVSASEILGFKVVLDTLNRLIAYLPHVLGAFLILIVALYIARVIKDGVQSASSSLNLAYAWLLGSSLEVLIVGFGIVMALTELGMDMTIFTANITIIIAGAVLAMAISIGLGSRSIMSNVLARYYISQLYHEGDEVVLVGCRGRIVKITPVSVVLQTPEQGPLHIPNEQIIQEGSAVRPSGTQHPLK
ncbi:MAG: mechanosensitive ion channel [Nitrospirales bacterium]|nr:mechanosensitive ion channel [Nitrospira sp.]MDR4502199.1 mechanosensitive ion channel [Nitrospirales bacterium]